jgi:hypothetical protein
VDDEIGPAEPLAWIANHFDQAVTDQLAALVLLDRHLDGVTVLLRAQRKVDGGGTFGVDNQKSDGSPLLLWATILRFFLPRIRHAANTGIGSGFADHRSGALP